MTYRSRLRWLRPVYEHAELLLFGGTLVMLFALGGWWASLLSRTIVQEDRAAHAELALLIERAARDPDLRDAPDVEVVLAGEAGPLASPLVEEPALAVDASPATLAALEAARDRRVQMVLGESGMMFALVGVCAFMLYRLVVSRGALQREMTLFLGQMSHEMKTPLAGLRALLETLARGRVSDEDLPGLLELGLQQIEREEHLIQTLLQAQRLRVSGDALQLRPLELADLLAAFVEHRGMVPYPVPLGLDVSAAPDAMGDRDALWTILENLVDNARKCDANRVDIRAWQADDAAFVAVSDDGRGFPPDHAEDLFRPFHSAHADGGARHGTGLGLFICRRLATSMRGDLIGRSDGPGHGATFVLRLPLPEHA